MPLLVIWLLLSTHAMPLQVNSQTFSQTDLLFEKMIGNVSKNFRPVLNQSHILQINVIFNLVFITEVDEVRQKLICNAWLNFSWVDQLRTWSKLEYGGIEVIHPSSSEIWVPLVIVTNSLQERVIFKDDFTGASIFWNGTTRWFTGGNLHTACPLTMTKFPFDVQTCYLYFLSGNYYDFELEFVPHPSEMTKFKFDGNGEWEVTVSDISPNGRKGGNEGFSGFTVTLTLKRRAEFFLFNIVFPIMLLSLLNFLVFVLPSESGEKVAFGITVLLSQTVYMGVVSEHLPRNSDSIPLVLVYLFSLLILGSLAVAASIAVVATESKGRQVNGNSEVTDLCRTKRSSKQSVSPLEEKSFTLLRKTTPPNDGRRNENVIDSPSTVTCDVKNSERGGCIARLLELVCRDRFFLIVFVCLWVFLTAGILICLLT